MGRSSPDSVHKNQHKPEAGSKPSTENRLSFVPSFEAMSFDTKIPEIECQGSTATLLGDSYVTKKSPQYQKPESKIEPIIQPSKMPRNRNPTRNVYPTKNQSVELT